MGLRQRLYGKRVYLDANIFIYFVEGFAAFKTDIAELGESLFQREATFFTSELTLCEVLVLPFRQNDPAQITHYRNLIESSGSFALLPTQRQTYVRASLFRGQYRLKTPGAIHMASAVEASCEVFLTADLRFQGPRGVEVIALERTDQK